MKGSYWFGVMLASTSVWVFGVVPALGTRLINDARQGAPVTIRVSSFRSDRPIPFVGFGGGGSLRRIGGSSVSRSDTLRAETPAELTADLGLGDVRLRSLVDSVWLNVDVVLPGGSGTINGAAARIVIRRNGRRIEVTGERPQGQGHELRG